MGVDVQNAAAVVPITLERVGIKGIIKPLRVHRGEQHYVTSVEIDLFVDLPATQKGIHMSRNAEIVAEVVDQTVREPCSSLEELASKIAQELLERHEYATVAETRVSADLFMDQETPSGRKTLESYRIFSRARWDHQRPIMSIGVQVVGMTVCPCAMETIKTMRKRDVDVEISHNQNNIVEIEIEAEDTTGVPAEMLVEIAEKSVSSPTYEILKRHDEGMVVMQAHENPKFVEDVVRTALSLICEKFSDLDGKTIVRVKSTAKESIHKHDAYAERTTTMEELRSMMDVKL